MPINPTPKLSDEEKAAAAFEKLNANMCKLAKNDEVAKVEEALSKGADKDYVNDKGHSVVHVAAAFGALGVIRLLFSKGSNFEASNKARALERSWLGLPHAPTGQLWHQWQDGHASNVRPQRARR